MAFDSMPDLPNNGERSQERSGDITDRRKPAPANEHHSYEGHDHVRDQLQIWREGMPFRRHDGFGIASMFKVKFSG